MAAASKQLEANRRNSKKSTGPNTPAGKIRSSLNGFRHGLTGQVAVLPDEDREASKTFTRQAEDEWRLNRARTIKNNRQ
jgi:hypothetical protein